MFVDLAGCINEEVQLLIYCQVDDEHSCKKICNVSLFAGGV